MAMYDDDNFGGVFPTRTGTPTGSANERKMLDSIGGSDGFRTQQKTNSDGSITMLRTRNGMPEFSRTAQNTKPRFDVFQGMPSSQNAQYGYKVSGGLYVPCLEGEEALWKIGDEKVIPFSTRNTIYRGDADWFDSRTPPVVEQVVTWGGMNSLARHAGSVYSSGQYFYPEDSWLNKVVGVDESPIVPAAVFVDGVKIDKPFYPGTYVLSASMHSSGKVRALLCILSTTKSNVDFFYIRVPTIYVMEENETGWTEIGSITLSAWTALLQVPFFNSSATKAIGILTEIPGDIEDAQDWVFEIDFASATLTKLEEAATSYYETEPGDPPVPPPHVYYRGTFGAVTRVLGVDYKGDVRQTLTHTYYSRSWTIANELDSFTTIYTLDQTYTHVYQTNSQYSVHGWTVNYVGISEGAPVVIAIPPAIRIDVHSYDLRHDLMCYSWLTVRDGIGYTPPGESFLVSFDGLPIQGVYTIAHLPSYATATSTTEHRYGATERFYGWNGFIRYVTTYFDGSIAVITIPHFKICKYVTRTKEVDLNPYLLGPDDRKTLIGPIFYRKALT